MRKLVAAMSFLFGGRGKPPPWQREQNIRRCVEEMLWDAEVTAPDDKNVMVITVHGGLYGDVLLTVSDLNRLAEVAGSTGISIDSDSYTIRVRL